MSGLRSRISMPSRPFSAYSTRMPTRPSTWVSAKTLRMSSSTIRTRRPAVPGPPGRAFHASSLVGVGQRVVRVVGGGRARWTARSGRRQRTVLGGPRPVAEWPGLTTGT